MIGAAIVGALLLLGAALLGRKTVQDTDAATVPWDKDTP
jgi:hypothetical protein